MKYMNQAKKYLLAASAAVTGFVSSSAFATTAEDIGAAFSGAEANVGLGVSGIIGVVALITGVTIVITLLKKV